MQREMFEVKRERFHLLDNKKYILQGNWPSDYEVEALLDEKKIPAAVEPWEPISAMDRFESSALLPGGNITMIVTLPDDLPDYQSLKIYAVQGSQRILWFSYKVEQLRKRQGRPHYFIEQVEQDIRNKSCKVRGWATFKTPVVIHVEDDNKKVIPCEIQMSNRIDVEQLYDEYKVDTKCGFFIDIQNIEAQNIQLVFTAGEVKTEYKISMNRLGIMKEHAKFYYDKGIRYLRTHGILALTEKVMNKMRSQKNRSILYSKWIEKHLPTKEKLDKQRREKFAINPKFSIVVPLYKTPEKYLEQLINSIKEQTYTNWELCLSDGSGSDSPLKDILAMYAKADKRIIVISHEAGLQIAENTNAAIEKASGDYIVFVDHDDELTADALYECTKAINQNIEIEVLYSDEDKMTMDGNKYFQPHFKPDFNQDLLCTVNYICHLFVVKREIIDKVGVLRSEFNGAQDYDFIFRCTESATHIYHIPRILYHWRSHEESTAENPESKFYAFDAGQRAIQAHYDRIGIKAEVIKGEYLGLYRTKFIRDYDPLISIIIPNKDHIDDLKRCMNSIEERATYRNYEYIIIENNSVEESTFAYYKELEKTNEKVRVVYYDGEFNYSKINNYGVPYANGEYLWLLNNDTEIINEDCIEEMLGYCMREDVGVVGARLYYEDDTIQHAGVVVGFAGIAGHCFVQQKRGLTGYCHRIICAQDYSAVTAACMLVKKAVFEAVDGFTEELVVAFNDIDFCLKVRAYGKLVVYNPYAELYHYESKSRGLEDTPEKIARFNREIAEFEKRWSEILRDGDPFYNPNLTLDSQDFSLKRI